MSCIEIFLRKNNELKWHATFTHLREAASIDDFLAGTSQSPKKPLPAASEMPPSTLTQRETKELSEPRAGSRAAENSSRRVSPASFDEPLVK